MGSGSPAGPYGPKTYARVIRFRVAFLAEAVVAAQPEAEPFVGLVAADAELGEHPQQVGLHGRLADDERPGRADAGEALHEAAEHHCIYGRVSRSVARIAVAHGEQGHSAPRVRTAARMRDEETHDHVLRL